MATVGRQRLRARQVYVAVATSTCEDDGHCGCKGLWGHWRQQAFLSVPSTGLQSAARAGRCYSLDPECKPAVHGACQRSAKGSVAAR